MKPGFVGRKLQIAITLVLLGLIGLFVYRNWDEFSSLSIEQPWFVIPIILAVLLNLSATGMQLETVLKPLKLKVSFSEVFGLAALTRFGNYIAPFKLGFTIRAYYLKTKYKLPISHFIATITAAHVILYIVSTILGFLSVMWLRSEGVEVEPIIYWLIIGLGLFLAAILIVRPKLSSKSGKVAKFINSLLEGWSIVRKDKVTLFETAFWALISVLSFGLMTYFEFRVFGVELGVAEVLFITSVMMLNTLVGITPAGLGISEGLIVIAANAIGVPVSVALATAILRRIVVFSITGLLSLHYSKKLLGVGISQIKDKAARREENASENPRDTS